MIVSLIVVALVGVGFTRLTMLALELREDYNNPQSGWDVMDVPRKRRVIHSKMANMAKPATLVRGDQNQFEPVGDFTSESYVLETMNSVYSMLMGEEEVQLPKETPTEEATNVTDMCSICFEKAPNAVLIRGCNHGGLCYSCAIDIYLTSGHCPFCRRDIAQIVIISLAESTQSSPEGRPLVDVIGPTTAEDVVTEPARE